VQQYLIRESMPERSEQEMALLVTAYLAIWNDPENLKYLSFSGKPFQETQVRGWFSDHVGRGVRYFVATHRRDASPAAIMIVGRNPIHGINIGGIGVRPKHKGHGIGKRLIAKCVDLAGKEGYRAIDTEVFANNFRMIRLLAGMEFLPVKMEYHRGCDGSDLLSFKKYLV
jgi:RimJ/RimL family protein N-acetyltransferase